MLKRNMGGLDRTLRFVAGVALMPIGLFALGGWQGHLLGALVAVAALMMLVTSLTGFCPGYVPLGISTIGRKRNPASSELPRGLFKAIRPCAKMGRHMETMYGGAPKERGHDRTVPCC